MKAGEQIGRYEIREKIGKGGMAEIFRAEERQADGAIQSVAIKRLFPRLSADREFVGMFVNEARIASSMNHPNIIQTYDLINSGLYYYIVMEYLEGVDLDWLTAYRSGGPPLTLEEIAFIGHQVARGLGYAHRGGNRPEGGAVVHRDISPGNILIGTSGRVKITDFGIARAVQYASFTRPGVLKGKFEYMAPEYVRGLAFDGKADVFSLGVVLYEMLTGANPFVDVLPKDIWEKVIRLNPPPPSERVPSLPKAIDAVVARALHKDVERRFQTADELAAALAPFFASTGADRIQTALGERVTRMLKKVTPIPGPLDLEEEDTPEGAPAGPIDPTRTLHLDDLLSLVEPVEVPVPLFNTEKQLSKTVPKFVVPPPLTARVGKRLLVAAIAGVGVLAILASFLAGLRIWPKPEAFLTVTSSQPADVFVDDDPVGAAPLERLSVTAGTHQVELRQPSGRKKLFRREFLAGQEVVLDERWPARRRRTPGAKKAVKKPPPPVQKKTTKPLNRK